MGENFYIILEVKREASDKDIKTAYRRLALRWHPDKNRNNEYEAEVKFKKISEVYNILGDSSKRVTYDRCHLAMAGADTIFKNRCNQKYRRTQPEKCGWKRYLRIIIMSVFAIPMTILFGIVFELASIALWLCEIL